MTAHQNLFPVIFSSIYPESPTKKILSLDNRYKNTDFGPSIKLLASRKLI
jgi:hypothetical protein